MDVSKESRFLIVKCNLRPLPNGGYGALSIFTGFLLIADSFFIKGESIDKLVTLATRKF